MALLLAAGLMAGCAQEAPALPYGTMDENEDFSMGNGIEQTRLALFAEELCAAAQDMTERSSIDPGTLKAACVYDEGSAEALYSYHAEEQLSPASLTKIMTALLVLENCENLDESVTIGNVNITENGAQLFPFHEGDRISLKDLLYVTLVSSANDAALALAQYMAGTEADFAEMMNERALQLGATHTHFVNSHGLSDDEHYTCAHDMYLIFREALKHPEFLQIIETDSYTFTYSSADGTLITDEIHTTNQYLRGISPSPASVHILGGKTGSTSAAGKCIILYAQTPEGGDYILVVMGAADTDALYRTANRLCDDCIR